MHVHQSKFEDQTVNNIFEATEKNVKKREN